jgi:cell division transport system permease protein
MTTVKQQKYQYDISLDEGTGAHLVTWVTGLMVFFVTLALAVNFAMSTVTQEWVTGLSGSLTVEIKPPMPLKGAAALTEAQQQEFNGAAEKILWLAGQHPAVKEAHQLTTAEIRALIQPWLGQNMSDDLPLPALIDLKLNADADIERLQSDILALVPAAAIDSHTDTLDDVKTLVNTIRLFVFLLTGVIVTLAVVAISGIVRSKYSIHKQEVETLHLIGASNEYIARQFRRHTLEGTLKGALTGLSAMIATLLIIGAVTHTIDTAIFPHLKLMPGQWALLILSPLLAGTLIAHATAQRTVMKELARLP